MLRSSGRLNQHTKRISSHPPSRLPLQTGSCAPFHWLSRLTHPHTLWLFLRTSSPTSGPCVSQAVTQVFKSVRRRKHSKYVVASGWQHGLPFLTPLIATRRFQAPQMIPHPWMQFACASPRRWRTRPPRASPHVFCRSRQGYLICLFPQQPSWHVIFSAMLHPGTRTSD